MPRNDGKSLETYVVETLRENGWMAGVFADSRSGQPLDVWAMSKSRPVLIECKDSIGASRLPMVRIRPNQILTMQDAIQHKIEGYVVFRCPMGIGYISFDDVMGYHKLFAKSIKFEDMKKFVPDEFL